jgi:putative salt-induced outer membrane protein YdiY
LCALFVVGSLVAQDPPAPQAPPPDRIVLKNGDPVTGTLKSYEAGKVVFESPLLGKLTIKLADIKEITTAKPVAILTAAGETVTKPITGVQDLAGAKAINIEKKPPVVWSGTVSIGGNYQSGNTDKRSVITQADFERRTENTRFTGTGSVFYEQEKTTGDWNLTDRVYRGRLQYDYFLADRSYVLVFMAGERDALADLDLRFGVGPGYGIQWVEKDELKFSTEIGPSYVREEYDRPRDTEEYLSARLRTNLQWQVKEGVTFLQDSSYFHSLEDKDDINAYADTRLRVSLTKEMFTQLQWIFEYDNTPSAGSDRVDHTVLLSVGVTF